MQIGLERQCLRGLILQRRKRSQRHVMRGGRMGRVMC